MLRIITIFLVSALVIYCQQNSYTDPTTGIVVSRTFQSAPLRIVGQLGVPGPNVTQSITVTRDFTIKNFTFQAPVNLTVEVPGPLVVYSVFAFYNLTTNSSLYSMYIVLQFNAKTNTKYACDSMIDMMQNFNTLPMRGGEQNFYERLCQSALTNGNIYGGPLSVPWINTQDSIVVYFESGILKVVLNDNIILIQPMSTTCFNAFMKAIQAKGLYNILWF